MFSLVAHEYAHGVAALRQGDDTAYMLGRLTLNPLPHIDPVMSVLMPALLLFVSGGRFAFGGAKPVPVNPRKYRNYKRGDIIVSAAGVVTNLGLSLACALLFERSFSLCGQACCFRLSQARRAIPIGIEPSRASRLPATSITSARRTSLSISSRHRRATS